jgi:hypothetical protein
MVLLACGAVLLLAPSGDGALACEELVATRVAATPMMPNPAYLRLVIDPVFGTNFTQHFEYKGNSPNDQNRMVHATWSGNWGQAGGPVADYVARVLWPGTAARK